MAKVTQIEPLALEALAGFLEDAAPHALYGAKGVPCLFTGQSAPTKAAAKWCIDNGWLEPTGQSAGKGRTAKPLYRLSPAGLQALLARGNPTDLLTKLSERLDHLGNKAADLPGIIQAKLTEVANQVAELRRELEFAAHDLKGTVAQAVERLKPPDIESLKRLLAPSGPAAQAVPLTGTVSPEPRGVLHASAVDQLIAAWQKDGMKIGPATTTIYNATKQYSPEELDQLKDRISLLQQFQKGSEKLRPASTANWTDEVIRLATEQKRRNPMQRLTLPQIYGHLQGPFPDLTLGEFHDGLRRLQDERRIRLGPFTQALATLDDPRNALFLDREVKYYVELA